MATTLAFRGHPGWGRRYLLGLLCSEGDMVEPPRLGWGGLPGEGRMEDAVLTHYPLLPGGPMAIVRRSRYPCPVTPLSS